MPRRARIAPGELIYHILNRANGRAELFSKPEDYYAFERIIMAAMRRFPIRLLAYCLMPNHWYMVLWLQRQKGASPFYTETVNGDATNRHENPETGK